MNRFLVNVLLALAWVMLTGRASAENFVAGFLLGALALSLPSPGKGTRRYVWKVWRVIAFIGYFALEVVKANLRLMRIVLSPNPKMQPAIVRVPVQLKSDIALTVLANILTLTPGTLSLDISEQRDAIFVHVIDTESPEALRHEIQNGFERRLKEILE